MKLWNRVVNGVLPKVRYMINDALFFVGLGGLLVKNKSGGRIILYHGIDEVGSTFYNTRFISKHRFEKEIAYYKKHFHVVSLAEYYAGKFPEDKLTIAITFDDGYENNFTLAKPILEKYKVPATFFIPGILELGYKFIWCDFMDLAKKSLSEITLLEERFVRNKYSQFISVRNNENLGNWFKKQSTSSFKQIMEEIETKYNYVMKEHDTNYHLLMSESQIGEFANCSSLFTIGSHGYWHNDITKVSVEEAIIQFEKSKHYLERITKKEVQSMAFPFGTYSRELVKEAHKAGYKYILPTEFEDRDDETISTMRKRFGVNPFISFKNQIYSILRESYT